MEDKNMEMLDSVKNESIREKVIEHLHKIEQDCGVEVLYACESGSRAWGFESKDSDWDIRFIYKHPIEWYLNINVGYGKFKDTIEYIDKEYDLDFSGWDLKKTMHLYGKGNPHLFEYLQSPVQYVDNGGIIQWMRDHKDNFFTHVSSMYHYLHMAQNNFDRYLQSDIVSYKKYLYVLRPILCCKWIQEYKTSPPVEFDKLVERFISDRKLLMKIKVLLNLKRCGFEMDEREKVPEIDDYLVTGLDYFDTWTKVAQSYAPKCDKQLLRKSLNNAFFNAVFLCASPQV